MMNNTKPDDYVYSAIDAIDEISDENIRKDKPKTSSTKLKWRKLNGWQKVWLALVFIQTLVIVLRSLPKMEFGFALVMITIIVNINCLIYGVGLAIAWMRRRLKGAPHS